ncbi:MAG: hypothetical protein U1A78_25260 [Polyangia bacterium]
MAELPVPEVPAIESIVTTDHAIHLVVGVGGDWDGGREAAVAELEDKVGAAERFAVSPAFRARFGDRIGIPRAVLAREPPSVVRAVMDERGVELEVKGAAPAGDRRCELCGRTGFAAEQLLLSDHGWACPSCARAWALHKEGGRVYKPQPGLRDSEAHAGKLRTLRSRLILPLLLALVAFFVVGALIQLNKLTRINNMIRLHLPRE